MWHMSTALYMMKEGVFCSVGRVDSLWPRCWGCLKAKHCSANLEESSGTFLIAYVWHSCFALILEKPYTPKKKCKVRDKHTKWWAVWSKTVWKALNSALLFQSGLCCFPLWCLPPSASLCNSTNSFPMHFLLLGHSVSCSAPAAPCPLELYRTSKCGSP